MSGGLHGVGVSVVNALSEQLKVWIKRDGKEHYMDFVRGDTHDEAQGAPRRAEEGDRHEGLVQAGPRRSSPISSTATTRSRSRLRELSFLNKGVTITLTDERAGQEKEETFHAKGGLREFVQHLNASRKPLHPEVIYLETTQRRHRHRARDAVQRRLQRDRLLVRQQHQHARRRHAPHRLQERADARHQPVLAEVRRSPRRTRTSRSPATTCAKASRRCCR